MLDNLIESKSNRREIKSRGGFLLAAFVLVGGFLFSAVLWSLYAKDFGIGREEFELSAIVAPIPAADNAPEPMPKQSKREQSSSAKNEPVVRQTNMLRVDETQPAPDKVSASPNAQKSRPDGFFLTKDGNETDGQISSSSRFDEGRNGNAVGIQDTQPAKIESAENIKPPPPPPVKKTVEKTLEKKKSVVSSGVVNGQATSLPKPPYPPAAKIVGASGQVDVQVTIDETGKVVAAKAVSGHPLLRAAAEKAALSAKFNPTLLSKQPVKVTGVIVYRFAT